MKNPAFEAELKKMLDIHDRKNSNYAHGDDPYANFRGCERFGIEAWRGILVRMSDKWERIQNLTNGVPDAVGESIQDTLMDLANYAILAKLMYEEYLRKVLTQPMETIR